jgi:hypothetical protein
MKESSKAAYYATDASAPVPPIRGFQLTSSTKSPDIKSFGAFCPGDLTHAQERKWDNVSPYMMIM